MPPDCSSIGPDAYPDSQSLTNWNNVRAIRIILAKIIREQFAQLLALSSDHASAADLLCESNRRAIGLTADILCSCSTEVVSSQKPCDLTLTTLLWHLYVAKTQGPSLGNLQSSLHEQMLRLSTMQAPGQRAIVEKMLAASDEGSSDVWKLWLKFGRNDFLI